MATGKLIKSGLCFALLVILPGATSPLLAQAEGGGEETRPTAEAGTDPNCLPPPHRLRLNFGAGNAQIEPGILNEAAPSWLLNSFIESNKSDALYAGYQPALPIIPPAPIRVLTLHRGLEYTFLDRLTIAYNVYTLDQRFARNGPTSVTFYEPANANMRWAFFEGMRLLRYVEDRRGGEIAYVHPILAGLKAGVFAQDETYIEINDLSLGSYTSSTHTSQNKPNTTTWSEAAIIPAEYRMRGAYAGPIVQLQLFDWLGVHYKFTPVRREGTFRLSGFQYLNEGSNNGAISESNAIFPFTYARLKDVGQRHNLEFIFTFLCNYGVHLGFLTEDLDRTYSLYLSETNFKQNRLVNLKTPELFGYGEMFSSHKISKAEVYLKFSAALYWQ